MEITLDKHSANQASIKITLNEADYQPKVDAKLKDYAKKAAVRGFRPGKAPVSMVKNIYGTSILVDEINAILGESLNTYLKEQTFRILGEPLPVEKADNSIDWKTQKEFDFEYKIGFVESVQVALDKNTKGTKYTIKVDDKLVNETIENLKSQYGNSTNPEESVAAELNQEFFDKIFGPGVVNSEEEFINKVKETLQGSYDRESKVFTEEELKRVLVESANITLPDTFLKEWLLRANEGKVTEADVENEYPLYAKQLTWSLISNHVAKDNNIQAEHADVIEKTKEMIREQFASSGLGAQLEASMDMFVDNYLKGNEGQNYMNMLTSVQNEKVLAFVQEKIDLEEKTISIDEFKELLEK